MIAKWNQEWFSAHKKAQFTARRCKIYSFWPKKKSNERDKDGEEIDVEGKAARFCPRKVLLSIEIEADRTQLSHMRKVQISFAILFVFTSSQPERERVVNYEWLKCHRDSHFAFVLYNADDE